MQIFEDFIVCIWNTSTNAILNTYTVVYSRMTLRKKCLQVKADGTILDSESLFAHSQFDILCKKCVFYREIICEFVMMKCKTFNICADATVSDNCWPLGFSLDATVI